ncbi:MAG: sugar ABC transporter permease [Chloroflexi bacterium]|nr:sugar ABC transporter permease [Chloroflexota bacterium]
MNRPIVLARLLVRVLGVGTVAVIALAARLYAVDVLPIDFDEDDYLRAGQQYATGLQTGDLDVFLRDNYRTEHPPLTKIVTGIALAPLPASAEVPDRPTTAGPAASLPQPQFTVARTVQAVFGALTAALLAVLSPLGAFWLAIHTWSIKYTSQVMLEAIPAFFALAAVMAYAFAARAGPRGRRVGLVAAAAAFGLACDGKYLYGVAGIAIVTDWLWRSRPERLRHAVSLARWVAGPLGWLVLSFVVFLVADPYLWPDPVGRLWASIAYHGGYVSSDAVASTGWPSWQPLVWLMGSVPFHPPGTFLVAVDLPITILAAVGFRQLWERRRVFALWLVVALVFLVVWPTKWPQYLLILSTPLSLSAAYGARLALAPFGRRARRLWHAVRRLARREAAPDGRPWHGLRGTLRDVRIAAPWLAPGLVGFLLLALIPLAFELAMSLTDLRLNSLRDGINGGVVREAVGGITGQIGAVPFNLGANSKTVHYVAGDLLGAFQNGIWLGGQTSAAFGAFSILWMVVSVGLQAALGIGVALVLERPGVRFAGLWRILFILPWAVPEVVGAIAWRDVFQPDRGLLAQLLGHPVAWPDSPDAALLVLLVAGTWIGWPLWMLVATAGLRTIPRGVTEAAAIDGAGRFRLFRDVTLPLLLPLLGAAFVIRGIAAFNQFYLFYVFGPPDATTTLSTFSFYVFNSTSGAGLYSVSAAINILTLVALGVVVVWFLRWRSRAERVAFV